MTASQIQKKASMSESVIKKVAGYWQIKKGLQHRCFPVDYLNSLRKPILNNFWKWP